MLSIPCSKGFVGHSAVLCNVTMSIRVTSLKRLAKGLSLNRASCEGPAAKQYNSCPGRISAATCSAVHPRSSAVKCDFSAALFPLFPMACVQQPRAFTASSLKHWKNHAFLATTSATFFPSELPCSAAQCRAVFRPRALLQAIHPKLNTLENSTKRSLTSSPSLTFESSTMKCRGVVTIKGIN